VPTAAPPSSAEVLSKADQVDRKRSLFGNLRTLLSLVVFVGTVVVAAMLINSFIFQSYYVDGTSMTPTLQNEDRLIIDKVGKTAAMLQGKSYIPKRGDIVVLDSSILDQYGHEEQLIKRVIGLPGDTILIQNGVVTIKNDEFPDGFNVDQQLGLDLAKTYSELPIEATIPEDSVFVLGDNRGPNGSFDSRSFGLVKSGDIQGRLSMRIFPFNTTRVF
jgi:signal peptidase I